MTTQAHLGGDLEPVLARSLDELDDALTRVVNTPEWWLNVMDSAHNAVGAGIALDDRAATLRGLGVMRDAGRAIMAVTFPQMRTLPLKLEQNALVFDAPAYPLASPDTWMRGFFAALILRDELGSSHLCGVPGSELLNDRVRAAPYAYMAVNCLRGLRIDADGWHKVLADAHLRFANDPDVTPYDKAIGIHVLRVLDVVYAGVPALDERLEQALADHRTWWTTDERTNHAKGQVALGPLALATWANSCGFPTTLTSGYLPQWLITSDW